MMSDFVPELAKYPSPQKNPEDTQIAQNGDLYN